MRPNKLNPMARVAIARAYNAGARPCDLAKEWGISQSLVVHYAKVFNNRQMERKAKTAARKASVVMLHRPKASEYEIRPLRSAIGRELDIWAVSSQTVNRKRTQSTFHDENSHYIPVSVPYVRFQHGPLPFERVAVRAA